MQFIKRFLCILAIAALAGCAAQVTQSSTRSPSAISTTRAQAPVGLLAAVVTGSATVKGSSDWLDFLEEWRTSLGVAATAANVPFAFAVDEAAVPKDAAFLVRLTVNDFKYVSTTKRFMLGILSGDASMNVEAQYIKLPELKPYGSNMFNTSSSGWEGIFSAVTPKQVQTVSEMIFKDAVSLAPEK